VVRAWVAVSHVLGLHFFADGRILLLLLGPSKWGRLDLSAAVAAVPAVLYAPFLLVFLLPAHLSILIFLSYIFNDFLIYFIYSIVIYLIKLACPKKPKFGYKLVDRNGNA
jgi:hypothetical protein